eukprot:303852-Rhodomonas_salina.1
MSGARPPAAPQPSGVGLWRLEEGRGSLSGREAVVLQTARRRGRQTGRREREAARRSWWCAIGHARSVVRTWGAWGA